MTLSLPLICRTSRSYSWRIKLQFNNLLFLHFILCRNTNGLWSGTKWGVFGQHQHKLWNVGVQELIPTILFQLLNSSFDAHWISLKNKQHDVQRCYCRIVKHCTGSIFTSIDIRQPFKRKVWRLEYGEQNSDTHIT